MWIFSKKKWMSKESFTEWFNDVKNRFDRNEIEKMDEIVYVRRLNIRIQEHGPMSNAHINLINAELRVMKFPDLLHIIIKDEIGSNLVIWIRKDRVSKENYWTFSILGEDGKIVHMSTVS